jgi:hypothetical protein
MVIKKSIITALFIVFSFISHAQILTDSTIKEVINTDTILRIKNINPYFTLHVDSTLSYDFEIKDDKRLEMVYEEIIRLNYLPKEKLDEMLKSLNDILIFNQNHLIEINKDIKLEKKW